MINSEMKKLGQEKSAIRELFEQGKLLKQKFGEDKVFDFSIGNPSVLPPDIVNDSLIKIINETDTVRLHSYTSAEGDINVRDSVANYLNKTYDANADKKYIYLTVGAAAALSITLKSLLNFGDEVIVFAPFFPEYDIFIKNAFGKTVTVNPETNSFYPDFQDLENKITEKTKAIIINSPNNPTGVFYNEDIIKKIVSIVDEKNKKLSNDIFIISDEPYRELLYVDEKYPFLTRYYDNSIVTYSFSKSLSIPGERVGYVLVNQKCKNADEVFMAICGAARSMGYVCSNSLFQYLIPKVQGHTANFNIYIKNKNYLKENLEKIGYKVINPDGAFYMFLKSPIDDAIQCKNIALKHNLLIVPSDSFGIKSYLRVSYCVDFDTIVNSIPAFSSLYKECLEFM